MSTELSKGVSISGSLLPADNDGDAPEGEGEGSDPSASLHPDLWRAMVSETHGARWYMDREHLVVIRVPLVDGRPASPVAEDPDGFVEIPTLATERQRSHARKVLAEQVGDEQAAFLTGEEPWLRHFHENASPELRQVLSDARRAWVIGEVRSWLREHDLPEPRFVRPSRSTSRDSRPPRRVRSLRDILHRALDRMTDRELEALMIPARLLVED